MISSPCKFDTIQPFFESYRNSLSSPVDSFLEDHILRSQFYKLLMNDAETGYFAIHNKELLTQFFLVPEFRTAAQDIFQYVKDSFQVKYSFVPTCDEFFLSHALDSYEKIEKQALFFQDSKAEGLTKYGTAREFHEKRFRDDIIYRQATIDDEEAIISVSGDFLDDIVRMIQAERIYVGHLSEILVAIGVIEKSKIFKHYASIGMFTNEKYRRQGIGRTTINFLKKVCYSHNLVPIAGCWYYNKESKMTLESAGMHTQTRLLKIH